MSWLMNDPIATTMYGPAFLFVYACIILLTLVVCWWRMREADPTANLSPLPLRSNPDPYEVAFLRGGTNEVIRLAIFDLIQRGYLKHAEQHKWSGKTEQRISQAYKHPDPRHLSPIESKVFDFFSSPRIATDIFQTDSLSGEVEKLCLDYGLRLDAEQVFCPDEVRSAAWRIGLQGTAVIVGLGGYKLLVALSEGHHNVMFLIVLAVASVFLLVKICKPSRLSARGRDYLSRLQGSFERLKPKAGIVGGGVPETALPLLVALFGVAALTGTSHAYFSQMFKRSGTSGGGCGGGCGGGGASSGCGGSSGCSGGGGCGGGGCGGCGGG
jgi:uncharacterized protein (TIGR04222 family)